MHKAPPPDFDNVFGRGWHAADSVFALRFFLSVKQVVTKTVSFGIYMPASWPASSKKKKKTALTNAPIEFLIISDRHL